MKMKYLDFTDPKSLKYVLYKMCKGIYLPNYKATPKDYGMSKKRNYKKKIK